MSIKTSMRFLLFGALVVFAQLANAQTTLSKKDTSDVRFVNARKFYIYKVDKGETLFSISQKFNIPQEEILEFNKDINGQGLKYKSKIWIPAYSWLKKDEQKLIKFGEEKEKNFNNLTYKIVVISALDYPKLYVPDSLTSDSTFVEEPIEKEIRNNLEFVEGVLHGADVMNKAGLKAVIRIIDSEDDTMKVLKQLNLEGIPDLIITNSNGPVLKWCAKYADDKNIHLISSGVNTAEQVKIFNNTISLLPSSVTQCKEMGVFMVSEFPNSVLLTIRTTQTKENERLAFFKLGWRKGKEEKEITIDYPKGGVSALMDSLSKSKTNVVFISSSNEDMATTILTELKSKLETYKIVVVGLPTWQYFETLDQNLLTQCNTHIFSSGFIQDSSKPVEDFRKFFRDTYNGEPGETAYQGYDAMIFTGKNLLAEGKKFVGANGLLVVDGLYTQYDFTTEHKENSVIHVFKPGSTENIDLAAKAKEKK